MNKEEKSAILSKVSLLKKELMMLKIKASSNNEPSLLRQCKAKRKEVARLLTGINQN